MDNKSFEEQEVEILKEAKEKGLQYNYFFATTFDRYRTLRKYADDLKSKMEEDGLTVEKEYVKGRKNLYASPALKEYINVSESLNRHVASIMKIFRGFAAGKDDGTRDPLMDAINGTGGEDDDEEADEE